MSGTLPMHAPEWQESFALDCYYGECDHDDECPTPKIEVCRACTAEAEPIELEELSVLVPWSECSVRTSPISGSDS